MEIILASASPRRRELLELLGIRDFRVMPAGVESEPPSGLSAEDSVNFVALSKARACAASAPKDALIIAADTLVYLDGVPLGKPSDAEDAAKMLKNLSGREHFVVTGVVLIKDGQEVCGAETTYVRFRSLSAEETEWYVSTGEPLDKAGAYGIQGLGSIFIEGITGDYYNVVGFPLRRFDALLKELGLSVPDLSSAVR